MIWAERREDPISRGMSVLIRYALLTAGLLLACAALAAPSPQQAEAVVRDTFQSSLESVREHRQAIRQDPEAAYRLIEQTLAPRVDFELIARLVLGRHWQSASGEQRLRFTAAFRESLLRTYAHVLSSNVDEIVRRIEGQREVMRVDNVRPGPDPQRVTVRTQLILGDQAIPIDYRLHARDGRWQAYDLLIGNISFVANFRQEYGSLLQRSDLDALIDRLEARNRQLL